MAQALKALAFNCSLKTSRSKEPSSTEALTRLFLDALATHEVTGEIVRVADFDIKPGVSADEGHGDEWPGLRRKVLGADVVVIGSPIWLGQPSSLAKRVLERMDAFLGEKDDRGRIPTYGKVAISVVVGNEDGAHHVGAEVGRHCSRSASRSPPADRPTGSGRRYSARTSSICRQRQRQSRNGRRCSPPTPRISRGC